MFQDSEKQCADIEIEKQRIQSNYDEYYQRTHHLEELQTKLVQVYNFSRNYFILTFILNLQNGLNHDQNENEPSSKGKRLDF